MRKTTAVLLLLTGTWTASGQTTTSTLEVNRVKAGFVTDGRLFTNGTAGQFIAPFEPGQTENSLLRMAGVWLGGSDPDNNLKLSVAVHNKSDFQPGVLDPATAAPTGELANGPWRVTRADIEQHLADFADNGTIDNPNPNVFGWPGIKNPFFATYNNGALLPSSLQGLAGFFDRDEDGVYTPSKGDYPALQIRGCSLDKYPDEMVWFPIHDNTAHEASLSNPLNVEVQCTLFAYNCNSDNGLGNTIFTHFKVINRSFEVIDTCYFGLFNDFTVGGQTDDYVGCDTERFLSYAYNADNDDAIYGTQVPAISVDLLRGPLRLLSNPDTLVEIGLTHAVPFSNVDGLFNFEYYRLLSGSTPNGTPVPNNGLAFPDNPNIPNGQSELAQNTTPGKRATVTSWGPFTLLPGAVNEIAAAYSFTEGASALAAVQEIFPQADRTQSLFDNCFNPQPGQDLCGNTTDVPREPGTLNAQIAPNPTTGAVSIRSSDKPLVHVVVTDLQGRTVLAQRWSTPQEVVEIDLNQQPTGLYLVRLQAEHGATGVAKVAVCAGH